MSADDTSLATPQDVPAAIALLTRLPVRADFSRGARAGWAYPLAGALVALIAALPAGIYITLGGAPALAAALWLATSILVTGALHEDGLADTADGFWGGWDPARRLQIMKDSRIGSYGVIALILSLGTRGAALALIMAQNGWLWSLIAVAMLSRAAMPVLMTALPHARDTGLSHAQGRPSRETAALGVAVALVAALLFTGFGVFALSIAGLAALAGMGALARAKIGGQTGDVLGATQQVVEILLLLVLAT